MIINLSSYVKKNIFYDYRFKVIIAKTQWELDLKVRNQKQRWYTKERQLKEQMNVAEMKKKHLLIQMLHWS